MAKRSQIAQAILQATEQIHAGVMKLQALIEAIESIATFRSVLQKQCQPHVLIDAMNAVLSAKRTDGR